MLKFKLLNTLLLVRQWINGEEVRIGDETFKFPEGLTEIQSMVKEFDNIL